MNIYNRLLAKILRKNRLYQLLNSQNIYSIYSSMYKEYYKVGYIQNDSISEVKIVRGRYSVSGHNCAGVDFAYFGELDIEQVNDKIHAQWKIGFTDQFLYGEGLVFGELMGVNFSYYEEKKRYEGLVIYNISDRNNINGLWIEKEFGGVGYESLKKKSG